MKIGLPKEIKTSESRVALLPSACVMLSNLGNTIYIEQDCGQLSGYSNKEYEDAGCIVLPTAKDLYANADLIVKVKEPQLEEYSFLDQHHILFSYLHLAANDRLIDVLTQSGLSAIAFEEVTDNEGNFPLLKPMSIIAGKLAAQYASVLLHRHNGGRGVLIDSINDVEGANVTVLGMGVAGRAAVEHFMGVGCGVTIIDKDPVKLQQAKKLDEKIQVFKSTPENIYNTIIHSDAVIGAVLIPGARAPIVVKRDWVKDMPSGAVIVDIAIDQGGCIENIKPTTYENPTYIDNDVLHFAVQNIPAAVPRTASQALSNAILRTVTLIAADIWRIELNIMAGLCVDKGVMLHA